MSECLKKICINCPAGCHLEIRAGAGGEYSVRGNRCPRGEQYAQQEMTDPRRLLTAAVAAEGEPRRCIPVKSTAPLPRALIPKVLRELYRLRVALPKKRGDAVLRDCGGTGIDVIVTVDVP